MIDLFKGFFKKESSSQTAKDRLRLVLMSDHLALAPDVVAALKADLLAVISRYVEIDPALADVTFESRDRDVAMLASIPILSVRDPAPRPPGGGGSTLAGGGGNAASPPREPSRLSAAGGTSASVAGRSDDAPAAIAETPLAAAEAAAEAIVSPKPRSSRRRRRRKPRANIAPLTA